MKALILAAGQGSRLRPMTNDLPKTLIPVNGKSILQYQLESLDFAGIKECVIVVGYLGHMIRDRIGSSFGGVRITYISNEMFSETNNIYSVWLARQEISGGMLLLEGDIVFERGFISRLLDQHRGKNVAVVDEFQSYMDGTVILPVGGIAQRFVLKSDQGVDFDYGNALKTVNIYAFDQSAMEDKFIPRLSDYIESGYVNDFYEAVIASLVSEGNLELEMYSAREDLWTEIDTTEDLSQAEEMFSHLSEKGLVLNNVSGESKRGRVVKSLAGVMGFIGKSFFSGSPR